MVVLLLSPALQVRAQTPQTQRYLQAPRVAQHDRVVVDVHHPRLRGHRLGHLRRAVRRRDAGSDVEELPDARLRQVPDRPADEPTVDRAQGTMAGATAIARSAASLSAAKFSLPPSR
jgi:hypothetical protein